MEASDFEKFQQQFNQRNMADAERIEALSREIERQKQRRAEDKMEYERRMAVLTNEMEALKRTATSTRSFERSSETPEIQETMANALILIGNTLQSFQNSMNAQQQSAAAGSGNIQQIFADPRSVVAEFYGTEEPERARAWIEELVSAKAVHEWSDAIAFSIAKSRLRESSLKWFLTNSSEVVNHTTFVNAFKKTFMISQSQSDRWKAMVAREQGLREPVQTYFHDKVWLCSRLDLSVDEIRDEVAAGLWSREAANHLLVQSFSAVEGILKELLHLQSVDSRRRSRVVMQRSGIESTSSASKVVPVSEGVSEKKKESTRDLEKTSRSGFVQNTTVRKCFRCKSPSHFLKDCPCPRGDIICYLCKKPGHIATRCPSGKLKGTETAKGEISLISNVEKDLSFSKFVRQIRVGESELTAQIDMGASVCTMRASTVLNENFKLIALKSKLGGFGSSEVCSPGIIRETVKMEGLKPREIEFRIVPDTAQDFDLILGRPFTEAADISYVRTGNELIFTNVDSDIFGVDEVASRCRSKEEVQLKAGTINFINVKSRGGDMRLPVVSMGDEVVNLKVGEKVGESILAVEEVPMLMGRDKEVQSSEVDTDEQVTEEQKRELVGILNEYKVCIADDVSQIGCTPLLKMSIDLEEGAQPFQGRPYRLNARDRADLENIIDKYKEAGIVTETNSEFASPVFIVRKADGSPRMVADFRKLNKVTKAYNFPIPNFDDLLENLNGAKFFIKLDLALGYLQMPLDENAKEKTAFITETQTGQFERAMFGLVNAPMYFAKLIDRALGIAKRKGIAFSFFDDICIYAKTWEDLIKNLIEVLKLLKLARLTLNLSKCKFGMRRIDYLGYTIGEGELRPGERKVIAISEFPCPKSKHDVRRFIGLANFLRRFVINFSRIAAPITNLLKDEVPFVWLDSQQAAFDKIKHTLSSRPALKLYNPKAEVTELHTDASAVGLGAILLQADREGEKKGMVYAISKKTTEVEAKYHSSRLELMAIAWALKRLRPLLIGIPFTIVTDCQCLININAWKTQSSQIARWISELAEFNFEIKHVPGEKMKHVDALSRAPAEESNERVMMIETREDEILMFQRSDPKVNELIGILRKSESERAMEEKDKIKDFNLIEGLLFKKQVINGVEKNLYYVPNIMRKSIAIRYHDLHSHLGVDKTIGRIRDFYYFPYMRRYIKVHVRNCLECILAKRKAGKKEGELHPIPPGRRPFEIIHSDHVGPFPTTSSKNKYVLGFIDNLTKFLVLFPVKTVSAKATVKRAQELIDKVEVPRRLITDRGTCFTSNLFQKFCFDHGIAHTLNSSAHPQANGLIERLNQTILPIMKIATQTEDNTDWDRYLKQIERDLNTSISKATGKTPYEAFLGYTPRFNEGELRKITSRNESYCSPNEIQDEIRKSILKEQEIYKARYDLNKNKFVK